MKWIEFDRHQWPDLKDNTKVIVISQLGNTYRAVFRHNNHEYWFERNHGTYRVNVIFYRKAILGFI